MKMYCMNCGAIKDEAAASAPVIYCLCGFAWWSSNPDFSRSIRNGSMPAPTEADALRAEVMALKAKLAEQEELAMWALSGGMVWLGSTIARGTGERVAIEVTSPYGGCEVIAGTHHVDRWECLRLARQIINARAEALAATKEV